MAMVSAATVLRWRQSTCRLDLFGGGGGGGCGGNSGGDGVGNRGSGAVAMKTESEVVRRKQRQWAVETERKR